MGWYKCLNCDGCVFTIAKYSAQCQNCGNEYSYDVLEKHEASTTV